MTTPDQSAAVREPLTVPMSLIYELAGKRPSSWPEEPEWSVDVFELERRAVGLRPPAPEAVGRDEIIHRRARQFTEQAFKPLGIWGQKLDEYTAVIVELTSQCLSEVFAQAACASAAVPDELRRLSKAAEGPSGPLDARPEVVQFACASMSFVRSLMAPPALAQQPAPLRQEGAGAGRVPDGWKLVPVEPTQAMLDAGEEAAISSYTGTPVVTPEDAWAAMLAVAPHPDDGSVMGQDQGGGL